MENPNYLIDCQGATVSYPLGGGKRRTVLDGIDLKVRKGELVTVVGPSGCGKSTLLRLILGSQAPNDGQVLVAGHPVKRVTRDCGIVFQNYALFPHMTVLENVMTGPVWEHTGLFERLLVGPFNYALGAQRAFTQNLLGSTQSFLTRNVRYMRVYKEARERAREILNICGLDPNVHGNKFAKELSGGMRQRVAIARAMIMNPEILLMDEPHSGLDHSTRTAMQEFVHEQWARGQTIFFVTHNLEEACKLGTRLICLSQHWCNDDGSRGEGARVIVDRKVEGGERSPKETWHSEEFTALVSEFEENWINDKKVHPQSSFVLTHEDACRSN